MSNAEADPALTRGRLSELGKRAKDAPSCSAGVVATARTEGRPMQHGKPHRMADRRQLETREGQTGFGRVAEGSVVPMKPGNAGGGKGPWFKATQEAARARSMGQPADSGHRQALQVASQALSLLPCPRAGCGKSARPVR